MEAEYKLEKAPVPKLVTVQEPDHSVMLYHSESFAFDLAVLQLEKVLGCDVMQACQYAKVAEQFGSVCVFIGAKDICVDIAYELSTIRLEVKVL